MASRRAAQLARVVARPYPRLPGFLDDWRFDMLTWLVPGTPGLMFGPALLGLLADATCVGTALAANAAALTAVIIWFAWSARCPKRLATEAAAR